MHLWMFLKCSISKVRTDFECVRMANDVPVKQKPTIPMGPIIYGIKAMLTQPLHLAPLPNQVTLLAASTLAQTASMAALSSRRRAFFSFARLDFLWARNIKTTWLSSLTSSVGQVFKRDRLFIHKGNSVERGSHVKHFHNKMSYAAPLL